MNPQTIKKIKDSPEFRELVSFVATEANKLNTLEGLEGLEITERAYEVTSRLRAFDVLQKILSPLVNISELSPPLDKREYTVDV